MTSPKSRTARPARRSLANRPFDVQMSAGTVNPNAGSYSPFIFRMQRSDDDQELSQITTQLPPGLTARIAGLTHLLRRGDRSGGNPRRTGTEEKAHPSCPASSQVGHDGSRIRSRCAAHLYRRARSIWPARTKGRRSRSSSSARSCLGPYDLGNIVVRSAVHVDRHDHGGESRHRPVPADLPGDPGADPRHPAENRPQRHDPQSDQLRPDDDRRPPDRSRRRRQHDGRRHRQGPRRAVPGGQLHRAEVPAEAQLQAAQAGRREATTRRSRRPW